MFPNKDDTINEKVNRPEPINSNVISPMEDVDILQNWNWDQCAWFLVAFPIAFISIILYFKTMWTYIKAGQARYSLHTPPSGWVPATFGITYAYYQYSFARFLIFSSVIRVGMGSEVVINLFGNFVVECVLPYYDYYFPNANKTPLSSAAANLVDVTSVQTKDSGLQTVPSTSSAPSEGHEVKQEVKPAVSRKIKIFLAVYICTAAIVFIATGYFPFLDFWVAQR